VSNAAVDNPLENLIHVTRNNEGDHASYAMGVEGYGAIKVEGTNAFVRSAIPAIKLVTDRLLRKYVDDQVAAGRSADEVRKEFLDALDDAVTKALGESAPA
jgi:hypothetical protein